MFDLNQSIRQWRQQMTANGIKGEALDELESHLRDDIEEQIRSGTTPQQAFEIVIQRMGQISALKSEFSKADETDQITISMNTSNPISESTWKTYVKAATFSFPAAILWLFAAVFVLPKVNEICQSTGANTFDFHAAPFIVKPFAALGQMLVFLTSHTLLIGIASMAVIVCLEMRSNRWARYRRTALSIGVFSLNAAVLVSITMMLLSVVISAVPMIPHAK